MGERIIHNRAECSRCGDIVESKHVHDLVRCKCGGIFVDGGREYLRRGFGDGAEVLDRSVFEEDEHG
jgi:ribosomal protein S27AE